MVRAELSSRPRSAAFCAAAFALLAPAGAQAQTNAPDPVWGVSIGVLHRHLEERADDGSRLLTESGPMLSLGLDRALRIGRDGALRLDAHVAAARLDYDGRTQGGVPLASRSGERDLGGGMAWRPVAAQDWGEGWLLLRALEQRRQIAATSAAVGLRETSRLLLAGVRWSHSFDGFGWRWTPSIDALASATHRLHVDYGGLFDASDLHGGTRRELDLALTASRPGSGWTWTARWTRTRQSASDWQSLTNAGAPAGTVRQPRIDIDDIALEVRRAF